MSHPNDESASLPDSIRSPFPLTIRATVFVILVCLSLIIVETWQTMRERAIQLGETEIATANLAQSVSQHAYDTFKEADSVLSSVLDLLGTNSNLQSDIGRLRPFLVKRAQELPQIQGLFIEAENGQMALTSGPTEMHDMNFADREYFQFHRDHTDASSHIGPAILSRSTGRWVITISRRINHADGSFAGVVLATIDMRYFQRFYERFDIGQHGVIFTTLNTNGVIILRRPFNETALGMDITTVPLYRDYLAKSNQGTMEYQSGIDGVLRIYSYRKLEQYPLVVAAGLSKDEALAEWRADAYHHIGAVVILACILGGMGFRLIRQIELRMRAEEKLKSAQQTLVTLNHTLEKLAMQDGLTGLDNRRQFDLALSDEFSRAMRHASSLALVMIDVDFFKKYNDTYGHAAGDSCLRAVSAVVSTAKKRPGDVAARYGGEEMVVLLPGTDIKGAIVVAESIRQGIYDLALKHAGSALGQVTVSAGVAAMTPLVGQTHAVDLIEAADAAMYRAKARGRNRVCD